MIGRPLLAAALTQGSCQVFKLFFYSALQRRWDWRYLVTAGGMPSAHSAFVSALAAALALGSGPSSDVFAIAVVFGAIVVFDALKLRGLVQQLADRLDRIDPPAHPFPAMIGHSPLEVVVGILLGAVGGLGFSLALSAIGW